MTVNFKYVLNVIYWKTAQDYSYSCNSGLSLRAVTRNTCYGWVHSMLRVMVAVYIIVNEYSRSNDTINIIKKQYCCLVLSVFLIIRWVLDKRKTFSAKKPCETRSFRTEFWRHFQLKKLKFSMSMTKFKILKTSFSHRNKSLRSCLSICAPPQMTVLIVKMIMKMTISHLHLYMYRRRLSRKKQLISH